MWVLWVVWGEVGDGVVACGWEGLLWGGCWDVGEMGRCKVGVGMCVRGFGVGLCGLRGGLVWHCCLWRISIVICDDWGDVLRDVKGLHCGGLSWGHKLWGVGIGLEDGAILPICLNVLSHKRHSGLENSLGHSRCLHSVRL